MKRLILTIVLLAGATALRPTSALAADLDCGGSAWMHGGAASAHGWCEGAHPGRQKEYTMGEMWGAYCAKWTRPYRENGTEVEDDDGNTSTIADIVVLSLSGEHPGLFGPTSGELEFSFMVGKGWDPTTVVAHYEVSCSGGDVSWASGGLEETGSLHFTIVEPVPVEDLRADALAQLEFEPPAIGTAPPTGRSIVNLATWLWVDEPWVSQTASAGQGAVTVTVTADPIDVVWTFDDNEVSEFAGSGQVVCEGPGEAWSPDDGGDDTECQYLFHYPSGWNTDGVFHGAATMRWNLTWTLNGADQGGFGEQPATSNFDVTVVEIQTVGVDN